MKKFVAMLLAFPLVASCAAAGPTVKTSDLASTLYVLRSVNGEAFTSAERTPEIRFDENMRVTGQVCNRFMGQGTLKDGVLTVPEMASTMMLCPDQRLNAMEGEFAELLRTGAQVALSGDTLTLRNGRTEYVYAAAGKPAEVADLASNVYVLRSVNGQAFAGSERTPEITFGADMRVAGQVCNRFTGQGTLNDGLLTVAQMASTRMLCTDSRLNEMEQAFAELLRGGARVSVSGDTLTLRSGATEYVYTKK